ncbi:MAG TPA: hypothetical protein DCS12_05690 [Clostridiales bacterium]|nr:hypothetical protein [Clostridiales bacterium]
MKIMNEPIKVMAVFEKNGKITPIKFRLNDQVVKVQKILKTYETGNRYVMFVCEHNGKDIYELKYDIKENLWYLYKK